MIRSSVRQMKKTLSTSTALALLLVQLIACSSATKKKVLPPAEDAGSDQGGAAEQGGVAGRIGSGGAGGHTALGGAAGDAGAGADDAGAGGTGGDAGAADPGGAGGTLSSGGTGGVAAAGGSVATSGSAGASTTVPKITSFAGPASACAGSDIDLTYAYSGGTGVVTPGGLAAPAAAGHVKATLGAQDTMYVLAVTSASGGAPATANANVVSVASPASAITTGLTVAHGETGVVASVSAQTQVTYAWSVLSGNAAISGSASSNQVSFNVAATGTEVALQVTVTSSVTACASTSVVHIPIRCAPPTLISLDRSKQPAVAQYVPSN